MNLGQCLTRCSTVSVVIPSQIQLGDSASLNLCRYSLTPPCPVRSCVTILLWFWAPKILYASNTPPRNIFVVLLVLAFLYRRCYSSIVADLIRCLAIDRGKSVYTGALLSLRAPSLASSSALSLLGSPTCAFTQTHCTPQPHLSSSVILSLIRLVIGEERQDQPGSLAPTSSH